MNDINRSSRNRDYLKRLNYPRATYALSGIDFGEANDAVKTRKKLNIKGAPMIITPLPPGASAENDVDWGQTYGASMDATMSLIDGKQYTQNVVDVNVEFASSPVYKKGLPTADNSNLYRVVGDKQQIHFIVGKSTVSSFRALGATPLFGIDARSLGMRAPMQMCGWGKTITMRPTDPEPLDKRVNDNEHLFDRSTWKVGPLDARWDDRRKVWRAFNDLIADDTGENLGTFVYSTNPDNACGFPFLRAKIEDIWSVRRTVREMGTETAAKSDDTTKTALLVTKLGSYATNGSTNDALIGSWADVLSIVPDCNTGGLAGGLGTCGSEKTTDGGMAIQTTANYSVLGFGTGPIDFSLFVPDPGVKLGSMYFDGDVCSDGVWRPGIVIETSDICEAGAEQFQDTYNNDVEIALALEKFCGEVQNAFNNIQIVFGGGDAGGIIDTLNADIALDSSFATTAGNSAATNSAALTTIEDWSKSFASAIEVAILSTISNAIGSVNGAIAAAALAAQDSAQNYTDIIIDDLIAQLNACLEGECVFSKASPELSAPLPPAAGVIPPILDANLLLSPLAQALDADSTAMLDLSGQYSALTATDEDGEPLPLDIEPPEFEFEFTINHPCDEEPPLSIQCG